MNVWFNELVLQVYGKNNSIDIRQRSDTDQELFIVHIIYLIVSMFRSTVFTFIILSTITLLIYFCVILVILSFKIYLVWFIIFFTLIICLVIYFLCLFLKEEKGNKLVIDFLFLVLDKQNCSDIIHSSNSSLILCFDFYFLTQDLHLIFFLNFILKNVIPALFNCIYKRSFFYL